MNKMNLEEAKKELSNLLQDHPDGEIAGSFLAHFATYCHAIDDIVDENISEPEIILNTHMIALNLFSSNFYRKYQDILYPVVKIIHHTWLDSVSMERSTELWKKESANILKNCSVEMTLAVIEILGGYIKRRQLSIAMREYVWNKQNIVYEINK